jgi:hypothetical protein
MLVIKMNVAKWTGQAAHFTSHASPAIDLHGICDLVPLNRSRGAHFQAPGIITVQTCHRETYFYIIIIFDTNIGLFPIKIPRLAECTGIFTIAANDTFGFIHADKMHWEFLSARLILSAECWMMLNQILRQERL